MRPVDFSQPAAIAYRYSQRIGESLDFSPLFNIAIPTPRPLWRSSGEKMRTRKANHVKRTFFPPRSFDDDLESFVQLARDEDWHFSGVDLEKLAKDAVEQTNERAIHDNAEAHFRRLHEEFVLAQEARYRRFAAALCAARAAFQCNAKVMSRLERFKRSALKTPVSVARDTVHKLSS